MWVIQDEDNFCQEDVKLKDIFCPESEGLVKIVLIFKGVYKVKR